MRQKRWLCSTIDVNHELGFLEFDHRSATNRGLNSLVSTSVWDICLWRFENRDKLKRFTAFSASHFRQSTLSEIGFGVEA